MAIHAPQHFMLGGRSNSWSAGSTRLTELSTFRIRTTSSALLHEPTFKQTAGEAVFNKTRLIDTIGNARR